MWHDLWQAILNHPDEVKTGAIGLGGTGGSIFLQDINQLMSGLAATATFVYVVIKIYFHFKDRK